MEFSDDQKMIQDQARQFLTERSPLTAARTVLDGDAAHDAALWQSIAELGWCGTAIPENYGGLELGPLELCVIAQELGRALTPVPFYSTIYLFAELLKHVADEQQKQQWLPKVAAGELIGTLALSETAGQSLMGDPACKVSDAKLTGNKIAVLDGSIANAAIVSASDDSGQFGLYLVELDQASVTRERQNSIDPSRPLASVDFNGADAQLLAQGDSAKQALQQVLDQAAVFTAFEQLGGSEAVLQMGMDYTRQRFAFGRAIASFQAIKHIFANMYVAIELARSNAYYAAWALSANDPELPLAAATARVSAIDAYYYCSKENIESHGGMGFTWEFDCHLYYKRAQLLSGIIGSGKHWRELVVERLLAHSTANT